MTALKFDLDIDAEIQKLGLPIANPANPANREENREENRAKISNFSKISNPHNDLSHSPDRSIHITEATRLYQKRGWMK
jgi:hypothetical protein